MKRYLINIAILSGLGISSAALAQLVPPPENVLQLSAEGTVEVQQDLFMLSMSTSRDGVDAGAVQSQLKVALDAALAEARKSAEPLQLEVRTGNFSLSPRYASATGRITGWQGTVEMVMEGRDFARISQVAGRIQSLTVSGTGFGLSREQRLKVEGEAQALAIERFRSKAASLAKSFGFNAYSLREVSVNSNDSAPSPRMRMQASDVRASNAEMAVPVQPGKSTVSVTVSGSVQLR